MVEENKDYNQIIGNPGLRAGLFFLSGFRFSRILVGYRYRPGFGSVPQVIDFMVGAAGLEPATR